MLIPPIDDDAFAELKAKEPTAYRIAFEGFGEVVFRKPKRVEGKRLQDAAKAGGDTDFLVRACLLYPTLAEWDRITEQEAAFLPITALDALCKTAGLAISFSKV